MFGSYCMPPPQPMYCYTAPTLSRREFFAAMALQGLLASRTSSSVTKDMVQESVKLADQLEAALDTPK